MKCLCRRVLVLLDEYIVPGPHTWVYLLSPILFCFYDRQAVQLRIASLLAGGVVVQPSVDVDARPLNMVSYNLAIATQQRLGNIQRTQHLGQHRISLCAKQCQRPSCVVGMRLRGGDGVHFPIGSNRVRSALSSRAHANGDGGYYKRYGGRRVAARPSRIGYTRETSDVGSGDELW